MYDLAQQYQGGPALLSLVSVAVWPSAIDGRESVFSFLVLSVFFRQCTVFPQLSMNKSTAPTVLVKKKEHSISSTGNLSLACVQSNMTSCTVSACMHVHNKAGSIN